MKRAFTLLELLVVVAIMGLLGTISVGGYRQMQRGMEERSALETASRFIRMAYQRAQIDRKPTAVYFWNETMREADSEGYENEIVVGKAVAVRQHGRISGLNGGDGLVDEFADLNYTYSTNAIGTAGSGAGNTFRLYNFDNPQELKYSVVSAVVESDYLSETFATHHPQNDTMNGKEGNWGRIRQWMFKKLSGGDATWRTGSAYGFEFGTITLPKGFLFGSAYSKQASSPVKEAGSMVFSPAAPGGSGEGGGETIAIYALRPGDGGGLTPKEVGKTEAPTRRMH